MRTFLSNALPSEMDDHLQECLYCGLDSAVTMELFEQLAPALSDGARAVYNQSRRLLAPYLLMMARGIRVDPVRLEAQKADHRERSEALTVWFKQQAEAINGEWPKDTIVNSPLQLKRLFYESLGIPIIYKSEKGRRKVALDRKALERISKQYNRGAQPAITLLRIRDLAKTLSTLESGLRNGRWHCSYNIAGTETGRRSSSEHPLGHGDNLQNKPKSLRSLFIADEGYVLVQVDQQQAESRDVAYLSGDENYIKAVEGADLHTLVASMVWGFEPRRDLADRKFYRDLTYRDICKRLGHGSNYLGTAPTLAVQTGVELPLVEDFQARYHLGPRAAFPGIRRWQEVTIAEFQRTGRLTTPFGRSRQFWGRPSDESVWREAIAYRPQSMTGERTALAIHNLYWQCEPELQLLQDGHDAVLFQVPRRNPDLVDAAVALATIELEVEDIGGRRRTQRVPWEIQRGLNWGPYHETKNTGGLR